VRVPLALLAIMPPMWPGAGSGGKKGRCAGACRSGPGRRRRAAHPLEILLANGQDPVMRLKSSTSRGTPGWVALQAGTGPQPVTGTRWSPANLRIAATSAAVSGQITASGRSRVRRLVFGVQVEHRRTR